ncbi:unnamed protein product [Prorocentrum cordatum]|uniref:Reverse transcriptase zinc-binding domain-containing protein n=1 Tax=Prorocentrum cordatum TaxID=2364126 RepID=A0ABN9VJJ9_9DINO|nr:unnamed protein product [Polarella glacialis]
MMMMMMMMMMMIVMIYRSGACQTYTRLKVNKCCKWCSCPLPSLRHLFQECPHFEAKRRDLARELELDSTFWASVPRVTSKSGWVCYSASPSFEERSWMLVATVRLGAFIARENFTPTERVTSIR